MIKNRINNNANKETKQLKLKNKKSEDELDSSIINKIYRKKDIKLISSMISMMGKTNLTVGSFLNTRLLLCIITFVIVLIFADFSYVLAPVATVAVYYGYYYVMITSPIKRRISKLDHDALNFFEILTLTLESGRNLENSLEITVDNVQSELSDEFKKTLLEIRFGKSLIETLEGMKQRIPSETINNIILNMTQTSIFGSNILDTMNNQIDFLRDKQLLEIKERMNKLPNKISIVSVLFIVPLILLLVLGPFIVNFIG